jgi:hypothetical protein
VRVAADLALRVVQPQAQACVGDGLVGVAGLGARERGGPIGAQAQARTLVVERVVLAPNGEDLLLELLVGAGGVRLRYLTALGAFAQQGPFSLNLAGPRRVGLQFLRQLVEARLVGVAFLRERFGPLLAQRHDARLEQRFGLLIDLGLHLPRQRTHQAAKRRALGVERRGAGTDFLGGRLLHLLQVADLFRRHARRGQPSSKRVLRLRRTSRQRCEDGQCAQHHQHRLTPARHRGYAVRHTYSEGGCARTTGTQRMQA